MPSSKRPFHIYALLSKSRKTRQIPKSLETCASLVDAELSQNPPRGLSPPPPPPSRPPPPPPPQASASIYPIPLPTFDPIHSFQLRRLSWAKLKYIRIEKTL